MSMAYGRPWPWRAPIRAEECVSYLPAVVAGACVGESVPGIVAARRLDCRIGQECIGKVSVQLAVRARQV